MRRHPGATPGSTLRALAAGVGALAGAAAFGSQASAAVPNCSVANLSAYGVAHATIASATDEPALPPDPEYCEVRGTVATLAEGAGPGAAKFLLKLPAAWSRHFVFFGCGGFCGSLDSVAANATDVVEALQLGYAVVNTDAGHEQDRATPDPTWILLASGAPNTPAIVDFFYRAVHQVAIATKALTADYYADSIDHAYFDGCSTGGRQAMMEGGRYPDDFDGLIAGDPIMDLDLQRASTIKQAKAFLAPDAYIPFALLPAIDAAVLASCDGVDGVVDGIIQNPAACAFDPRSLVPATLTSAQADALTIFLRDVIDTSGRPVAPGMTLGGYASSGFAGEAELAAPAPDPHAAEPWGGTGPSAWLLGDEGIRYLIERNPAYDVNNDWPQNGRTISDAAVDLLRQRSAAGDTDDPQALHTFLAESRKIIFYHGFSDAMASPYRSIGFYKALAKQEHGYARLQANARLFMVPGMGHCGGGAVPNIFDTLTALDEWVALGIAPEAITAADSSDWRTMPLCKFPEEARMLGGPVDYGSSWTCDPTDRRLLRVGFDGWLAGADAAFSTGTH